MQFKDKVAIVTGGASGIGAACVDVLAAAGAQVVVVDINGPGAEAKARGHSGCLGIQADVTDAAAFEGVVQQTLQRFGRLDYAVNNAGGGGAVAPTGEFPVEAWRGTVETYLSSVFYCMRAEIPAMLRSGGGAIVNVASVRGLVGREGAPAYTAAKHGVVGLTKVAALDYAQRGIRVNAVAAGYVRTPALDMLEPSFVARMVESHPIGRLADPVEIATAIEFLLSDKASFCTGTCLAVDGGFTAR